MCALNNTRLAAAEPVENPRRIRGDACVCLNSIFGGVALTPAPQPAPGQENTHSSIDTSAPGGQGCNLTPSTEQRGGMV